MKTVIYCTALGLFTPILLLTAEAGPATLDCGGGRTTGVVVVHDGSLGGIGGISNAGVAVAKHGYIGQLYDVAAVAVTTSPGTVDEGGTRQLDAEATMDDDTTLALDPSEVAWSESSAALSGISGSGLASAAIVFENTVANVNGNFAGIADADGFDLTVLNVNADDFGSYAGDGIDDDWQVGFFGLDNPQAAPGKNPDGDPDDNTTEFLAGFDPTDSTDFLLFTITGKAGTTVSFLLNKAIPGRTYRLMESADLATPFAEVGSFSVLSEETDKVVLDMGAPSGRNYYGIEISK